MDRVVTFNDESETGQYLLHLIQGLKDPAVHVSEPFKALTPEEWVTPGKPATTAQIEYLLNEADEKSFTVNEVIDAYKKLKKD